VLVNVWQAYNAVTEAAVTVGFKSSILDLAQLREEQAAELLVIQEALTQSQGDALNLEKTLAVITGAWQGAVRQVLVQSSGMVDEFGCAT
jgi:hypothetical protein